MKTMNTEIDKALEVLKTDGVIIYPTETIWGIGCDATSPTAVQRIYQIKKRMDSKSMLVLLDSENRLSRYVEQVPELAWDLIDMTNKPLTIIYPNAKNIAPNLIAEDGSIGIRVSSHEFCKKLIFRFGKPIVSTSANISGQANPRTHHEIPPDIISQSDYMVNPEMAGTSTGKASGIIKLELDGQVKIIRE